MIEYRIMTTNETQLDNDALDDDYFDAQDLRVINILAPGQEKELDDVPEVSDETLECYYTFLKQNLPEGLVLTGCESIGHFSWEERFEFGYSSEKEFERLRKKKGSYRDSYTFIALVQDLSHSRIFANVMRTNDKKQFCIPLEDLESKEQTSQLKQILEDYSYWFENYNL